MSAVDIYGVFVPALLVMAVVAVILMKIVTAIFVRFGIYRLVWHRPLFDVALFVIALGLVFRVYTSVFGLSISSLLPT